MADEPILNIQYPVTTHAVFGTDPATGRVVVEFGREIKNMNLTPEGCLKFAVMLIEQSEKLRQEMAQSPWKDLPR